MAPASTSAALSVLALGFLLGLRHATDADHVLAVATIVSRERRPLRSSWIGILWGIGHTLTILLVGGAILFFRLVVPPRIGLGLELAVAAMLVTLGAANLVRVTGHVAAATEGAATHHGHHDRTQGRTGLRPLVIGVVHGLAGSAAICLLVLSTIGDSHWALAYLAIFGAGTIAGMALLTTAMALPLAYAGHSLGTLNRKLVYATGFASVTFGLGLAYQLLFVQGLLSSAPQWVPG